METFRDMQQLSVGAVPANHSDLQRCLSNAGFRHEHISCRQKELQARLMPLPGCLYQSCEAILVSDVDLHPILQENVQTRLMTHDLYPLLDEGHTRHPLSAR